jgi:hypothetical protein
MAHPLYYAITSSGVKEDELVQGMDYIGFSPKEAAVSISEFKKDGLIEKCGDTYKLTARRFAEGDYVYDKVAEKHATVVGKDLENGCYILNSDGNQYSAPYNEIKFAFYPYMDGGDMSLVKSLVELIPIPKTATDKRNWKDAVSGYFKYFWNGEKVADYHTICMLYNRTLPASDKVEPIKSAAKQKSLIDLIPAPEKADGKMWASAVGDYITSNSPFEPVDYNKIAEIYRNKLGGFENDEPLPEHTSLPALGERGPKEPERETVSPDAKLDPKPQTLEVKDAGFEHDEPLPERTSIPSLGERGPKLPDPETVSPDGKRDPKPQTKEQGDFGSDAALTKELNKAIPGGGKGAAHIETGLTIEKGQNDYQAGKGEEPNRDKVSPDKSQTKEAAFMKYVNMYIKDAAHIETGLTIEKGQNDYQAGKGEEPNRDKVSPDKSQTKEATVVPPTFEERVRRLVIK